MDSMTVAPILPAQAMTSSIFWNRGSDLRPPHPPIKVNTWRREPPVLLGLIIGAGCRFFDIPSPAPPRLIGACLLLAMTLGFVTADYVLPTGKTIMETYKP
jgi:XapX domain-containing protein